MTSWGIFIGGIFNIYGRKLKGRESVSFWRIFREIRIDKWKENDTFIRKYPYYYKIDRNFRLLKHELR